MKYHEPVMVAEVLKLLQPVSGGLYVDSNLGSGGHTLAILRQSSPDGQVLAFEWDEETVTLSRQRLKNFADRLKIFPVNFTEMFLVFKHKNLRPADGVLFDLGLNSGQISRPGRGISYLTSGPLDMRMNQHNPVTAADLIAGSSTEELAEIIKNYGQEPGGRRIARNIKEYRGRLTTTGQLRKIIEKTFHGRPPRTIFNAVVRTFQALRIAVNQELDNLKKGLAAALEVLRPGGRLVVISFHSLEDRIVKEFFQTESRDCLCPPRLPVCVCRHKARLKIITRKPLVPSKEEIAANPRGRSGRLRAAEKRKEES